MSQLSPAARRAIHQFAFWVANRSVGKPVLDGVDYSCIFEEPSAMQIAFAVFVNVLEVDAEGGVTNEQAAERRAAQWIRQYCDEAYTAEPALEAWELELP